MSKDRVRKVKFQNKQNLAMNAKTKQKWILRICAESQRNVHSSNWRRQNGNRQLGKG